MIKFDKDVHGALKALEKEGFATYAAGECVKNLMLGLDAYDWDFLTEAELSDMKRIFPDAKVLKNGDGVRVVFAAEAEEGEDVILDMHHMTGTLEETLSAHPFAIEAMADNPERGFVDPFNGREDFQKQLINLTQEPSELFKKNPICMLQAVRLAAETGFDLHKSIFEGIVENWRLLLDGDISQIREEFERLLITEHAGKGLSMLVGTQLINVILGEEVVKKMSASESREFNVLCENIDKTQPVRLRRLGLVYAVFSKKRGLQAIERLQFDEKSYLHLHDAMVEMINIHFLTKEDSFKRYLYEVGLERYEYMHNLVKAQRIVYDQPTLKIEGRNYMMKKIKTNGEPVFVEDLVIDANDLMEAGIADTPEQAEMLLHMVVSRVHKDPKFNDRNHLLHMARKYAKNKLAAKLRNIDWVR
ncbi:MAG: hypothetical protein U0M21_05325 [Emergencia sp.]|nr:hypothetical protein [Emergencia sp.]